MTDTRARIVTATGELFRRNGYHGTSVKQITTASGTTMGSLYHFFPGGKAELAAEVLITSGATYGALFEAFADDPPDAASAIEAFFEGAAALLEELDFIEICAIGTVAREIASTDDGIRRAAQHVFDHWVHAATQRLTTDGIDPAAAQDLAATVVAALEGGILLARTARDSTILRTMSRQMRIIVAAAAPATTGPTPLLP
jgi:AcrR family transcriptional regulator